MVGVGKARTRMDSKKARKGCRKTIKIGQPTIDWPIAQWWQLIETTLKIKLLFGAYRQR